MTHLAQLPQVANSPGKGLLGCLRRIAVLSGHTFTQLVRMRIFYFMLVFSFVLFGFGFLTSNITEDQSMKLIKDVSFWVMQYFCVCFGIVSTALLLPKDLEDRTLYTILSKPVRRWEYLLGKYFGVMLVLVIITIFMDVLSMGVLQLKLNMAKEAVGEIIMKKYELQPGQENEYFTAAMQKLEQQGPRWDLQIATVAVLAKAAIATAAALLISTFAGSTIFTMMVGITFYICGHLQGSVREHILTPERDPHAAATAAPEPPGLASKGAAAAVAVAFPDFRLFDVVDAVVIGKDVPAKTLGKLLGLGALYAAVYLGLAAFIFSTKEL
jgi:ABC-2 type transport system permease protein